MARSSRSRQEWEALVAEFGKSGLSQAKFADGNGVSLATLQYWIYKLRREESSAQDEAPPGRFVEVVDSEAKRVAARLTLAGCQIEFEELPRPEYLGAVLKALSTSAPC